MRKLVLSLGFVALSAAFAVADLSQFISRGPDVFGGYTTDYILVRFKHGQMPKGLRIGAARTGVSTLDALGARWRVSRIDSIQPTGYGDPQLAERLGLSRTFEFKVPHGTNVSKMVAEYNASPLVEFAELDGIGGVAYTPNDPLIGNCWGLNNTGQSGGTPGADIRAYYCWDYWKGGSNVTLAVVDTGVDGTHPEMVGKMVPGWNTYDNNNNTTDGYGHGTHVAGTAGANADNSIGIAGVSFGVRIMPMRVLNSGGSGTEAQCGAGMVWAADHGANICTMSLQYYTGSTTFRDNVDYAFNKGVLLIAANGNNQGNLIAYPAKFANCYGVGATTNTDAWASFSNYGPECDVSAPGQNVYSIYPGGGYATMSGTSMATPHTSGLASLVWSFDRGLTNTEVFDIIKTTADDKGSAGWDQFFGWGRINAQKAIQKAILPIIGFTSMSVDNGSLLGGTVSNLYDSDDQYVRVQALYYPTIDQPQVRVSVSGTAPNQPYVRLQLLLETAATAGGVIQRVEAYDYSANQWTVVDERSAPRLDGYTIVNVTSNPSRFVAPGSNTVTARVSFFAYSATTPFWTARVDQFRGALRAN